MGNFALEAAIMEGTAKPITVKRAMTLVKKELVRRGKVKKAAGRAKYKRRKSQIGGRGKDRKPRATPRRGRPTAPLLSIAADNGAIFWQHAADKCGLKRRTLETWIAKGCIKSKIERRFCARRAQDVKFVQLADVERHCKLQNIGNFYTPEREIDDEVYVLLNEAVKRTDKNRSTLREWCVVKFIVRCVYSLGTPPIIWCNFGDLLRVIEEGK